MWLALALTDEGWMETVTGSACPSSRTVNLRPPPPPPLPPLPSFLGASATITCEESARHTGLQPRSQGHGVAATLTCGKSAAHRSDLSSGSSAAAAACEK